MGSKPCQRAPAASCSTTKLLLLLMLASTCASSAAAQSTLVFSNGFETGAFITSPARSSETGIISTCSGATASVKAAAARTGAYGALLTVKAVCANWRLKLQTRDVQLTTTNSYALCMWVKSNYTAQPFLPTIALSFYKKDGTLLDAVQPRITNQWGQYCYSLHKPPADGLYFWNLNVGKAAAYTTYFIDDVTLTSEPNSAWANWVSTAPARIEQLRKGDFSVDLRYQDGSRVPASAVQSLAVTMKKHDFVFGAAYSPENFAQSQATQLAWYKNKAATLFNGMVPENAFKWPYFEPTNNSRTAGLALLNQFYNFTATSDYKFMRQHTIEWFLPDTEFTAHWPRKSGCAAYAVALKTRIERELPLFPGVVKSLDVFNELLQRRAYAETCNLFTGGPNSVIVSAFKWANAVRPNLRLCLNDYDLVSSNRFINYVEMVQWLVANGAPVHCVGVQSHLGPADILPDTMAYRLEKLSALLNNLPIEVTEVSFHSYEDPKTWQQTMTDEAAQADGFNKMLTTYFSHPRVNAVLLWGFVDTNHFIPSGGIYRADGTPKPAGTVVENLITTTWNTSSPAVTFTTSALGLPTFRGFYGHYDVTATVAGTSGSQSLVFKKVSFVAAAGAAQTAVLTLPLAPPAAAGSAAPVVAASSSLTQDGAATVTLAVLESDAVVAVEGAGAVQPDEPPMPVTSAAAAADAGASAAPLADEAPALLPTPSALVNNINGGRKLRWA